MELRQLEYFLAVWDNGGFTRAAEAMHVTQPGVSSQIRSLERELGHRLLDRSGRTLRLTEVGEAVLPYARAALEAATGLRGAVDALTGLTRGRVSLGTVPSHAVDIPELLAGFRKAHPGVEVTLSTGVSDDLMARVGDGSLDLALTGIAAGPPTGVAIQVLAEEVLVAAVCASDPLSRSSRIPLAALKERGLVTLSRGTALRAAFGAACAEAGFTPRVDLESTDLAVVAQLAARGLGVAILPASATVAQQANLHTIALTKPQPTGRIALAWRDLKPVSPAARAFIDHARDTLAR